VYIAALAWPLARFQFQAKARLISERLALVYQPLYHCAALHALVDEQPAMPATTNTATTAIESDPV
jgi:hypothetical protein